MADTATQQGPSDAPAQDDRQDRRWRRLVVLAAIAVLVTGLLLPAFVGIAGAAQDDTGTTPNGTVTEPTDTPSNAAELTPGSSTPTPAWNETSTGSSDAACDGMGFVQRGVCHAVNDAKENVLRWTLDVTQGIIGSTLEFLVQRPVPESGGEMAVFRPPTNQPLAGVYDGWAAVGFPLGFLMWTIGVGVALAARFQPQSRFAGMGIRIEQHVVRNLLLVIGSWWLGAFILHVANALVLAVAPRGDQILMGPQSGVGALLGTASLAGLVWVATGAIASILFVLLVVAYFLCLTFMVFLPVFSALVLFDTGGVMQSIGSFGRTGWEIFVKAAFFPLPAALVLGAGAFIGEGTIEVVEETVAVAGFDLIAGTLAFAIVAFVTQLTAVVATLWMVLGSRTAQTVGGVIAGLGGAAAYTGAAGRAKRLAGNASMPSAGASVGGAGSPAGGTTGMDVGTDTMAGSSSSRGGTGDRGGVLASGGNATSISGTLGTGGQVSDGESGDVVPLGTPTGGRPASSATGAGAAGSESDSPGSAGGSGSRGPVTVEDERDLPDGQQYRVGYVSGGAFQQVEDAALSREMVVKQYDQFVNAYDDDGDHRGVRLLGERDRRLYDAAPVAGEDWGVSAAEETSMSRDAVYDARGAGGGSR